MANILPHLLPTLSLLLLFPFLAAAGEDFNYNYAKSLNPKTLKLRKEKLTHFRVYWHDIYSGKNPSVVRIIDAPANASTSGFGMVSMIDDPLTESPDLGSKLVGHAQGFYGVASQEEVGLLMAMNFMFMEGKYNGSSITVLGRNPVFNKVREMPVIGGSGLFRWARGYVHASTHSFDLKTGDAVVEYNVYVLHY